MAAGTRFRCPCGASILAWDDGDPYVLDADGSKRYVHHPDPEREHAVGLDVPHLCLGCGVAFAVDSEAPRASCPACRSARVRPTTELAGASCPFCNAGSFDAGTLDAIS